ncbi:MAG: UDP-3-O-acyl-N-acetylglucosamine deacetylase [Spirochaetota bacterium]
MFFQTTIRDSIELNGIGLHSGKKSTVYLMPAPVSTGIVFVPYKEDKENSIRVYIDNLLHSNNAITIGNDSFSIKTIEHFMAAFYALDITNLFVVVDGTELPILDGSSNQIVESILETGSQVQNAFYEIFYLPYPIWIEEDGSYLIALPSNNFKITYTIDFSLKSSAVGTQTAHFNVTKDTFINELASARTFGFLEDIDYLKANNLAMGGSLHNALVYTRDRLINEDLRFTNECVRHKILDLIGDLSLVGYKMMGHFIAHKSGHSMDMALVKKIDRIIKRRKKTPAISRELLEKRNKEFKEFKKRMNL